MSNVRRQPPSAEARDARPRPWDWLVFTRFATVIMAAAVIVGAGFAISTSGALSQAYCQESFPAPDSVVARPPSQVLLWFSESVNPTYSTFTIVGRDGIAETGAPELSADGRRVRLPVSSTGSGTYVVRYQVSTTGGNLAAGFFRYRVAAGGAAWAAAQAAPPAAPLERVFGWLSLVSLIGAAAWWLRNGPARPTPSVLVGVASALSFALLAWLMRTGALLEAPIAVALRAGLAWPTLAGTHIGSALLLASATVPVFVLPPSPRGRLLRIAVPCVLALALALVVLSGGLLHLVGSAHFAPVALMLSAYLLGTAIATAILPELGDVRIPFLPWTHFGAIALVLVAAAFLAGEQRPPAAVAILAGYLGVAACWLGAAGERDGRLATLGFQVLLVTSAFAIVSAIVSAGDAPRIAGHGVAFALAAAALARPGRRPSIAAQAAAAFLAFVTAVL
ncbi:MAG: copper resistance protein CopC [Armatimonadetes bacterium]|nr:copper resistance protein CopC [Armatimonadota bacterium]